MAGLADVVAGFINKLKPGKKSRKKKLERVPVIIADLNRKSEVTKALQLSFISPLILLSIKEYREKNNENLKKTLTHMKEKAEDSDINMMMLDKNWVLVLPESSSLIKP